MYFGVRLLWNFVLEFRQKCGSYLLTERFASAQSLEQLIGLRVAYLSQLSLNGFGNHLETLLKITSQYLLICVNFGKTLDKTIISNKRITQSRALVPQNSRVRKISLLSADG